MNSFNRLFALVFGLGIVIFVLNIFSHVSGFVNQKEVSGKVLSVQMLAMAPTYTKHGSRGAGVAGAVLIQADDGKVYSSSTEDRQWLAVEKGMCVNAVLYPYGPMDLTKKGTYHDARLVAVKDCK